MINYGNNKVSAEGEVGSKSNIVRMYNTVET